MAYQIPTMPWPENFNQTDFTRQFVEGYQKAIAIKNQKDREAEQARQDAIQNQFQERRLDANDRQQAINEKVLARQQVEKALDLMKTQAAPTIALPAGIQGPEAEAPRPQMTLPAIPEVGVAEQAIKPQYLEDVRLLDRADADLKTQQDVERAGGVAKATEPFKVSDDERAAKLAAQRDAAYLSRVAAHEKAASDRADAKAKAAQTATTTQVSKLRAEYNQQLKPYLPQVDNYNKAEALAAKPMEARTAADDMALVFIFMRSLDPGSTVREGEYATAKNAAGVPERVRNMYNAAISGQFLSTEQRSNMASSIRRDYSAGPGKRVEILQNRYKYLAAQQGISDPNMVVMDIGAEQPPQDGPKRGDKQTAKNGMKLVYDGTGWMPEGQ